MALLITPEPTDVGVALFFDGSWQQGYYWHHGMEKASFVDKPKSLPNDMVWITNIPYEQLKGLGVYFKSDRFFRVPNDQLLQEICSDNLHISDKTKALGMMIDRLGRVDESAQLRDAGTLSAAMAAKWGKDWPKEHPDWTALGISSKAWYWKGAYRHRLLSEGHLWLPRFEWTQALMSLPFPDFSKPPKKIEERFDKETLRRVLYANPGFVQARIEKVSASVQDFISLDRTFWTSTEILWLLDRATITTRALYLTEPREHPFRKSEPLATLQPFSWLDGLRMEGMYLAPGRGSHAAEAFLRASAHVAAAFHAEYLAKKMGISVLQISMGKLSIAYSTKERAKIMEKSRKAGLIPQLLKSANLTLADPEEFDFENDV